MQVAASAMARRSGAVKVGRKRGVVPRAHGGDRGRNGKYGSVGGVWGAVGKDGGGAGRTE